VNRLVCAVLVLTVGAVGCKHPAPALKNPGPATLAPGWTPVSDAESGVSLVLPSGWRVGVPRNIPTLPTTGGEEAAPPSGMDPALAQMAQGMEAENAEAEKKELARMREKEGIVLHCVDGSKPTIAEEPTRLYVKRVPDVGFGELNDAAVAEQQDQKRNMKKEMVDLPVGKAMKLTAKGQNRIGDEECHVSYLFLDGNDEYVLRFASTNNPDAILSIEKQVAEGFRVRPKTK
jgi:hypothetical protein